MKFGLIVNVNDVSGLVTIKELKKHTVFINNFIIKDKLKVIFGEFKDDRIIFFLPDKETD